MGPYKYVFVKKYDHHYSFQVYDKDDHPMWRCSFQTIAEAQSSIPADVIVDWGELIDLVDFNQTKTQINQEKIDKFLGLESEE